MAVHIDAKITEALLDHFVALNLPSSVTGGVEYPNVKFERKNKPYVRISIFKNEDQNICIGLDERPVKRGIFQASVFWPAYRGIIKPTEVAGIIKDHFDLGVRIITPDFTIRIDEAPSIGSHIQEDKWVQIPVSVNYIIYP